VRHPARAVSGTGNHRSLSHPALRTFYTFRCPQRLLLAVVSLLPSAPEAHLARRPGNQCTWLLKGVLRAECAPRGPVRAHRAAAPPHGLVLGSVQRLPQHGRLRGLRAAGMDLSIAGMTTKAVQVVQGALLRGPPTLRQFATETDACAARAADHSVFVGDLAPEVNDFTLQEHFRQHFASVRSAKVRRRARAPCPPRPLEKTWPCHTRGQSARMPVLLGVW